MELDVRNQICPIPVKKTKQALKGMSAGEVLHVISTDPSSQEDIPVLIDALADELVEVSESNGEYHYYIKKS